LTLCISVHLDHFALTVSRAAIIATPLCCEQGTHILVQCSAVNSRFYASYFKRL